MKKNFFSVVILGGGSGGLSVAARLKRKSPGLSVAVVEPSVYHYYQPLWTLVGAGLLKKEETRKPQTDFIPSGVEWIQDRVERVLPEEKSVLLNSGARLSYSALVVATGLQVDFHRIEGLVGNLGKDGVCSIYDYEGAEKTAKALSDFKGGKALFTMPPVPIKCAGAPQKICYLADGIFRKNGVREKTDLVFLTSGKVIFGVPEFAKVLLEVVRRKRIQVEYGTRLVAVKPHEKKAVFEVTTEQGTERSERSYDLLHIVPPMSAHSYVKDSGLAFSEGPQAGWLEVDRALLQHPRFTSVFGVGDVTGVPNSKTGAAIRKQAPVVAANLLAYLGGKPLVAHYDGYSSCPLVTEAGKVILAEFGYEGKLLPSFPLDPTRERRTMWWLKRYLLAPLYWRGMLSGRF